MPTVPGSLLLSLRAGWMDENGEPCAGWKLSTWVAGTSTPKPTYTDSDLTEENTNPVILDSAGRATVYLSPGGYKFTVTDADDVLQWTQDNIEDIGQTFFAGLGEELATGALNVTSGYTVLATDNLVTVQSTGGPDPCVINLPPAAERGPSFVPGGFPLTIKNVGDVEIALTPNGSDSIEGIGDVFTIPAGATPNWPTLLLVSDGAGAWWILSSHALVAAP